jgi:hypothetical protein
MIRNKDTIRSHITLKDKQYITDTATIIEFPKRYLDKDLVTIGTKTYVYGIFAIIIGDTYSVSIIPSFIETSPLLVKEIVRDGIEYIQFHYGKNMVIIENDSVIRNKIYSYNIVEEFYLKGNVPWYIEYNDLNLIFSNLKYYADSDIGNSKLTNEVITSYITRDIKDKHVYHRLSNRKEYCYIALDDIYYATLGTINKLSGSYFDKGLVSALVQPEKSPTQLEKIIRK